jgi:primary-amine oxidase
MANLNRREFLGAAAAASVAASSAPALASAIVRPAHPLDPLTPAECAVVKAVLASAPQLGPRTLFVWTQLREPPKEEVLAFVPGRSFRREALAVALSPEHRTSYQFVVDIAKRTILSSKDLGNLQPFLSDAEYDKAADVADASPEIRAALLRRGFTLPGKISDRFFIDVYAPGDEPETTRDGKTIRAARTLFADRQGGRNDYGPYVEGLMGLVDLYAGTILKVIDDPGAVAHVRVPEDIFSQSVLGPPTAVRNLNIAPKTVTDLHIDGNSVRWTTWHFRYGFNQREGLVLYQVALDDAGEQRSVCYRMAVSEMLVPYSDPSPGWVWREFFDSGEYGLGLTSTQARPGKELPDNALSLDVFLPDETLTDMEALPGRVYFYERDAGALLAHAQESDHQRIYARAKELVCGFVATIGNYDYMFEWVFRLDGSFAFEAHLNGLILNKTVTDRVVGGDDQTYGTLVSPQMLGVTHQHWINLRLDFDVDGTANTIEECNVVGLPRDPKTNPGGRALVVRRTTLATAREAARMIDDATNRTWVVFNPSKRSAIGHTSGFEIAPEGNTFSSIPEGRFGEATSFVQRHLWVTPYNPEQLYAAGWYPNQHPQGYADGLVAYSGDQSIVDRDIVVWYSLGFTHITRPEDFPIMPSETVSVSFKPRGFFTKTATLGYARLDGPKP